MPGRKVVRVLVDFPQRPKSFRLGSGNEDELQIGDKNHPTIFDPFFDSFIKIVGPQFNLSTLEPACKVHFLSDEN